MARLINRTDVWGSYREDYDGSGQRRLGKTTKPAVARRGRVRLTEITLAAHFRAYRVADLAGTHTTSPENRSRWGACELDYHGPGGNSPQSNLAAVLAWYARLAGMRFRPLLTSSNGLGGYHLRLLLAGPAPTAQVFDFLRDLTADYRRHGLGAVEVFPKQRQVPTGGYGNWLRLPGRHHSREHWSQVWDGSRWLEGEAAVSHILGLTGDDPALLPPERPQPPVRNGTSRRRPRSGRGGSLSAEIAQHLAGFPARGEGQDRDTVGYAAACYLLVDKRLDDDTVRAWLEALDARNDPPKGDDAIDKWMHNAKLYARNRANNEETSS
jgi:hypothetical protein